LSRCVLFLTLAIALFVPIVAHAVPESLGRGEQVASGVRRWTTKITRADGSTTLWIYLPDPLPADKLPCVFVAPAGSPLVVGNDLGEGAEPEHIPYAQAGMAVVAYSISGGVPDNPDNRTFEEGARVYMKNHAGLTDSKAAIDYAVANLKEIDSARLYTAGHSSAGTLALLTAEFDPRIAACLSYAGVPDIIAFQSRDGINALDEQIDGFRAFLQRASPITNVAKLKCPIFLFHADDDSVVNTAAIDVFYDALRKTNDNVTYIKVPSGDHYQSMIDEGIPKGIAWLKGLNK